MTASITSSQDSILERKRWKGAAAAAFGLGLTGAWAAIAVLWIITPLSYLYVLWTLITLIPTLSSARPAQHGALQVLHYIVLTYASCEIPFSIYYRYLAIQANARRPNEQYSRKFLRSVFKRSLENGLINDDDEDPLGIARAAAELEESIIPSGRSSGGKSSYELRNRRSFSTPQNDIIPLVARNSSLDIPLHPVLDGNSTSTTLNEDHSTRPTHLNHNKRKSYTPSFIETPLSPDDPRVHDFRDYLRGWFNGCKYEEIKSLNMKDWLAWSLYGQPYEELIEEREIWIKGGRVKLVHLIDGEEDIDEEGLDIEGDKLGLVDHCVDMVEARAAMKFEEGRNPDVKVIRLTLDPVKVISRPLILYLFVWCLQKTIIGNSKIHGFKEYKDGDTRYLLRIPKGWTPSRDGPESKRPLLFLHGLGMGMAQYATLLSHLSTSKALKERPICVLVQPHISMSFFSRGYLTPPDKDSCTDGLLRMVKRWNFEESGITVLSHSNGTIVHGWLVKRCPDLVVRSCFVDPVCFCLWEPYVCFNFLYSKARTPLEYLMRFFVSRELGVALMLQRAFSWSSNLLFPSEIPNLHSPYHSAFYLAGKDAILNAPRIRIYLRRHGVKEAGKGFNVGPSTGGLKVHALLAHGQSMIGTGRSFHQIMNWVEGNLDPSELSASNGESDSSGRD